MKLLRAHNEVLEYLDKHGPVNTFRLSRDLGIGRAGLISTVKKLTKEGLTKFKSGVVTKGDKTPPLDQKTIRSKEVKEEKPLKSKILKEKHFELDKIKTKIQRLRDNWIKKEEELKKEIEDLQAQRNDIAQKVAKERALLYQIKKEKKETERNLAEWEKSLSQREESVQKREEYVSGATKGLKREKEKISKAKVLKKDIHKLEAILEDLKKKVSIGKEKFKRLKKKEIIVPNSLSRAQTKPKVIAKGKKPALKPKIKKPIGKIGVSKIETKQPEIMPKDKLEPAIKIEENAEDKFHDLIEQEISLLKQKRIEEARDIHLQIKDMVSEISDSDQIKTIVKDWNRVKEFY